MTTPRLFFLLAGLFLFPATSIADSPTAKKPAVSAKVKRPKSWDKLVAYVLAHGADRSIKSPLATNLGYTDEAVATKAFRYKRETSPDGREHVIHAVYSESQGKKNLTNIVLTDAKITEIDGKRHVEGYTYRLKPDGTPISAVFAKGVSGDVIQTKVDIAGNEAKKALAAEKALYTKTLAGRDFDE
jgi:hypothetical protein